MLDPYPFGGGVTVLESLGKFYLHCFNVYIFIYVINYYSTYLLMFILIFICYNIRITRVISFLFLFFFLNVHIYFYIINHYFIHLFCMFIFIFSSCLHLTYSVILCIIDWPNYYYFCVIFCYSVFSGDTLSFKIK